VCTLRQTGQKKQDDVENIHQEGLFNELMSQTFFIESKELLFQLTDYHILKRRESEDLPEETYITFQQWRLVRFTLSSVQIICKICRWVKKILILTSVDVHITYLYIVTCQPFDPLIQLQRLSQRLCGSVVRNN
jgi:hypothetical protein